MLATAMEQMTRRVARGIASGFFPESAGSMLRLYRGMALSRRATIAVEIVGQDAVAWSPGRGAGEAGFDFVQRQARSIGAGRRRWPATSSASACSACPGSRPRIETCPLTRSGGPDDAEASCRQKLAPVEAQWAARRRGSERFVCEQLQYSVFARSAEQNVLPTCHWRGMGVITWSPLAGGWLTGKYRRGEEAPPGSRYGGGSILGRQPRRGLADDLSTPTRYDAVDQLQKIAGEAGLSITHLALALRSPPSRGHLGHHRAEDDGAVRDLLAAADVELGEDILDAIDHVVRPGTDIAGTAHFTGNPSLRPQACWRTARPAP
jgi:hypothetical protein